MATKGFGAKEINISGEVGTPTIETGGNLNINAVSVGISTTLKVGTAITAHAGVITATSYYGSGANLSDVVTTGGAGQGGVTVNDGSIVGTALSISGISTVGTGITMYGDTSIMNVGAAITMYGATGIVSATSFYGNGNNLIGINPSGNFQGFVTEECEVTASTLNGNTNIDLENGNVHYFTSQESTTSTPNLRYNGSTTLASSMATGRVMTVTIITTGGNTGGFSAQLTIDGDAVTEEWLCGTVPATGSASGLNVYTYTVIKTGSSGTTDNDFTVLANLVNYTN